MQCKTTVIVTGVKRGKGELDGGKPWSNCKVTTLEPMLATSENQIGLISNEYRSDYEIYPQFTKVPGRYKCEIEIGEKSSKILSAKFVEEFNIKL